MGQAYSNHHNYQVTQIVCFQVCAMLQNCWVQGREELLQLPGFMSCLFPMPGHSGLQ